MADFIPILAQQSRLSQIPIMQGQLIFVFDAGKIYIDYANQRYAMCSCQDALSDAPNDGYLYARYSGHWQRIETHIQPQTQSDSVSQSQPVIPNTTAYYGAINDNQTYAVSQITQSMLTQLTPLQLEQDAVVDVDIVPGSVTCVLVPQGYAAYKDDGFGGQVPFQLNNGATGTGANGTVITLGGNTYKSYGQFNLATGNTIIYIQQES